MIGSWRDYSNRIRPHSSLGYRPPAPVTLQPIVRQLPTPAARQAERWFSWLWSTGRCCSSVTRCSEMANMASNCCGVWRHGEPLMETMHDYIAEIQTRSEDGSPPAVEARKSILAENDPDAQRQAEEWASTATTRRDRSTFLRLRHDDRIVIDRELGNSVL